VVVDACSDRRGGWVCAARSKLDPNVVHHPVVVRQVEKRTADVQLKVADAITAFAGSMNFVYIHAVLFAVWMLAFERSPWPTLTLVVSLEAIFLSTFVMIGQNRQAAFQQAKADHDYQEEEHLLGENTDLTRMIHQLTTDIHQHVWERRPHRRPAHSLRRCDATRRGLCWCVRAARVVGVRCRGGRVRVGGR